MPPKLQLAPGLALPLDAVTETLGIFGRKGQGKSSTAATFVEQGVLHGGRFVIADPTGVWWGLMHDGVGPGLPGIVFGGEHADVPLEATAGHVVAEFVVQQDEYPVVVLDMKLMRKADRTRFMLAFLETLYHDNREALHVVLDEAHQFAPTQAREGGETIKLLGAVEDVVALGRSRGLGISMLSQRFATLNANVREQIGTLVTHQLVGSLDRKALKGWIEAQADPTREKEMMEVIAKLGVGQALVWSPAFLRFFGIVDVNAPTTFDSRATPKVGQRVKKPGKRAQVDLGMLRERMAATIEEAERNDPKKLRAEVARLNGLIAKANALNMSQAEEIDRYDHDLTSLRTEVERLTAEGRTEVPVLTPQDQVKIAAICEAIEFESAGLAAAYGGLRDVLYPLASNVKDALMARDFPPQPRPAVPPRLNATSRRTPPQPAPAARPVEARPAPGAAADTSASGGASTNGSLGTSARHFLTTMARFYPMRLTLGQLGLLAARKTRGGSFNTAMRQLRDGGYVADDGEALVLTAHGQSEAGVSPEPMTLDRWREVLPMASREILDVLVAAYPNALTIEEAAERAGRQPRGGSWNTAIKMLVLSEVVERSGSTLCLNSDLAG